MRPNLQSMLVNLDTLVNVAQRRARRALKRPQRLRIAPYRGWVTREKAVVLGRALQIDVALDERLQRSARLVRVAYERFWTLESEPVPVEVRWQQQTVTSSSDPEGFIDVSFPVHGAGPATLTHAELLLENAPGTVQTAEILPFHPQAAFGVISDIDDTVLETELSNPWKRSLQLIYSEQRMRLPFDGIGALYRAFAQPNNPIFYVSNAPWNLYSHVAELLDHHDLPKGPLLLRNSGLVERTTWDETSRRMVVHKQAALRRIVEDFPRLEFVLLGDSSRRDALRYVEIAEAYPKQVAAIYIRRVSGVLARRDGLEHLVERARRAGVELLVADDTVTIAKHAEARGFVARGDIKRVREGQREDEQAPPAELGALAEAAAPAEP